MNHKSDGEKLLKILHIEDSPRDAEIIREKLISAGFSLHLDWAANEQEFTSFLQSGGYDLVLADYELPGFNAPAALELTKSLCPGIPFICVSGAIGEDKAVELLKQGATDYVSKNRLDKLPLAIERTLNEHNERKARVQAEEALRESETKLRAIFDTVGTGIIIVDKDTQIILEANLTALEMTGLPQEKIIGQICHSLVCPAQVGKCPIKDLGQNIDHSERKLLCAGGDSKDILKTAYPITIKGRACYIESFIDISDRLQAEEAMRESEDKFRKLANAGWEGIVFHKDGVLIDVNNSFLTMFGCSSEDAIGKSVLNFLAPESIDVALQKLKEYSLGGQSYFEAKGLRKDNTIISIELMGRPIKYKDVDARVLAVRNITERKRAEEEKVKLEKQLFQAHKMEAIGTLAGGVAHDFNNILAAIIGYTEMAVEESQKEIQSRYLQETLKGAERAKNLVKQILTFSRQDGHEKKPLDIKLLLKEAVKFLRASIPATIEIRQQLTDESCNILADPTQIHQIIINLCTNAGHAMKQTGGILTMELSTLELSPGEIPRHPDLKPGSYVKISVSDTGCGIDSSLIQRIFDPFFTTKSKEEGTGLGLSVVYGIVKSHDGVITVYSELGKGASFSVYLPRIIHAEVTMGSISETVSGGTEQILFVDDEPALVDIGILMLSPLGYKVTGVTSSNEALDLLRAEPERFDLVITDMTLPKMTGIDLSREILRIRPGIPIILCSGLRDPETQEQVKSLGIRAYCTKPLTRKDLSRVIRKTLDGDGI